MPDYLCELLDLPEESTYCDGAKKWWLAEWRGTELTILYHERTGNYYPKELLPELRKKAIKDSFLDTDAGKVPIQLVRNMIRRIKLTA